MKDSGGAPGHACILYANAACSTTKDYEAAEYVKCTEKAEGKGIGLKKKKKMTQHLRILQGESASTTQESRAAVEGAVARCEESAIRESRIVEGSSSRLSAKGIRRSRQRTRTLT